MMLVGLEDGVTNLEPSVTCKCRIVEQNQRWYCVRSQQKGRRRGFAGVSDVAALRIGRAR